MLGLLVASAAMFQGGATATRFDLAERLLALDFQWTTIQDKTRHAAAVPHLIQSVNSFFTQSFGPASRQLDEARSALLGIPPTSADAITLRFEPPFAEPHTIASLKVSWAYIPQDLRPLRVSVGSQSTMVSPGREVTIQVHPEAVVPELNQSPEAGVLVPVAIGEQSRTVYLSVVKGLRYRATSLLKSTQPEAKYLATQILALADAPVNESERPLIQMLFAAEMLDEGRERLNNLDEIPLVHQGTTDFRIAIPHNFARRENMPATVVIALHGAGGTENMFFEALGHGQAVKAALSRGWIFASPKASGRAAVDVLTWIKTRRHLRIARVLLIGHSLGGLYAVGSAVALTPKPAAIALFSPAVRTIPADLNGVPIYLAYAKQDLPTLMSSIDNLRKELSTRRGSQVQELDTCEHLMSPADGLPSAYKFFDSVVGPRPGG